MGCYIDPESMRQECSENTQIDKAVPISFIKGEIILAGKNQEERNGKNVLAQCPLTSC